jgi:methyl-accepting chemotaxis protein
LKYWVVDAATTQFASSEQAAENAKAGLDSDLMAISVVDPAFVAAIGREVSAMTDLARQAGVAYSSDDSVSGNALLEQAKSHVLTIDGEIDKIVDTVEQQAVARRDASMRGAELAVKLAIVGGIGALVLALGFTALTVRSITVPLKQVERSIASITNGDLDAPMPPTGVHEIGAMARTLGMLRDSLSNATGSSANASEPRGRSASHAMQPRRRFMN